MDTVGIAIKFRERKNFPKENIIQLDSKKIRFISRWYSVKKQFIKNNVSFMISGDSRDEIHIPGIPYLSGEVLYYRLLPKGITKVAKLYGGKNCPIAVIAHNVDEKVCFTVKELIKTFRYISIVTSDEKGNILAEEISGQNGAFLEIVQDVPNVRIVVYFSGNDLKVPRNAIVFDPFKSKSETGGAVHINNLLIDVPNNVSAATNTLATGECIERCLGKKMSFYIKDFLFDERIVNIFDIL